VDAIYEKPKNPDVQLAAGQTSIEECVQNIVSYLVDIVSYICSASVVEIYFL